MFGLSLAPLLSGCSAVGAFNALVPYDGGSSRVADGISFGPHERQKLDIYAPPEASGQPVILFIYGGSWSSGSRSEYTFIGRALASRGFVTVIADYRLVPEIRYPEFLKDGALALRWTRDSIKAYGGSAGNLFIMGHSAGAYNAIEIALDSRILAAAGLESGALRGAIGLAGPYDFLPIDSPITQEAFGSWPNLPETQPINHAKASAPPIFVAAGSDDVTVYPRNTVSLARHLRAAGASVEEKIYPGVTHAGIVTALSRPFRSKAPVLDDVVSFIHRHALS